MSAPARITRLRWHGSPVPGIDLVAGWRLFWFEEPDTDGFWTNAYFARGDHFDVKIDVSRFRFSPSQERFAWLVRNGFPPRPTPFGGWDDADLDAAMADERDAPLATASEATVPAGVGL